MKKILILLLLCSYCGADENNSKQVDLENISTKGLDKNVAKVFKQTKKLILNARKTKDKQTELLGSKQWCFLLHNFEFLQQAKQCYFIIGMEEKAEGNWPYLYGKAAMQEGNMEDAIKGLEQTIYREANYLSAHYYLIKIAIEQGDLLKAFEYKSNVPTNLQLTANMLNITGDLFSQVENYHVANGYYQQALSLVPKANSLNYKIAQNYHMLEEIKLAENYMALAGQVGISLADPYYQQVKDTIVGEIPYLIKAKTALLNANYKKAIKSYNKALKYNPKSKSATINIAVAYFQDNQIQKAQELFKQVLMDDPRNHKAMYNLAIIAKSQNDITNAIRYFEGFRQINDQDKLVNIELAELYYMTKNYQKTILLGSENLLKADEIMQILKAKSLVHTQQFQQAIVLLEQINKYKPNNIDVLLLLAKLLSQVPDEALRNGKSALEYAKNAFHLKPNQLSYWQLFMALDEAVECNQLVEKILTFSKNYKFEKAQVTAKLSMQRGKDLKCKINES